MRRSPFSCQNLSHRIPPRIPLNVTTPRIHHMPRPYPREDWEDWARLADPLSHWLNFAADMSGFPTREPFMPPNLACPYPREEREEREDRARYAKCLGQ
jgi:hypothetical protein